MTSGQLVEAGLGFVVPTAAVVWGIWMVWRWIRPDFKQASRIVPGVVEFVLVCILVILILLGWEMFKTWRRPPISQHARLPAADLPMRR